MAYKNLTALNVVNVLNQQISKQYPVSLPAVDKNNFSNMADQLRVVAPEIQNAWCDSLINLVGLQILKNKRAFESYFRKLYQGDVATENIQLQMMDVIESKVFSCDADAEDFFKDEKPEVGVQYVCSTVKKVFPISINEDVLYAAFLSEDAFMNFLGNIETRLYDSMELEDTLAVEAMITKNIKDGNIYLIPSSKVVDQATALAFTAQVKSIAGDMAVKPSPKYNLAGFHTWTPREEGVIISDTDTKAVTETYSLAWAFNKDYLALEQGGQAITMANDSIADGAVFALYADRYAFELRNKTGFPKAVSEFFGSTLTLKRWLHYQVIMAMSWFNNCAAFADSTKIDDAAVATLATRSGNSGLNRGAKDQVYVSALTVTDGKIFDKFGKYELSGNTDDNTVIDAISGKIRIGKDEVGSSVTGLEGKYVTVTWTSHLDANITATLNIKINS